MPHHFTVMFVPHERTPNHEMISLAVASRVATALAKSGNTAELQEYVPTPPEHRALNPSSIIFNLVYGYCDGVSRFESQPESTKQLEGTGNLLVGSDSTAQFIAQDKLLCGEVLKANHVRVPTLVLAGHRTTGPCIIKRRYGACHYGARVLDDGELVTVADDEIAQGFVEGREFTVGVLEIDGNPVALPPLEIVFPPVPPLSAYLGATKACDYVHCSSDSWGLMKASQLAFSVLCFRDYARFDFRVDRDGAVLIDANSLPNLHPECSFLPRIARNAGIDYDELVGMIAESAMKRAFR